MTLTKLILLIVVLNLVGSLFKRMQKKAKQREIMDRWDREEAEEGGDGGEGGGPPPADETPGPLEEPPDVLANFFEKLRERTQVPREPAVKPVLEPVRDNPPPPSRPRAIVDIWETPAGETGAAEETVPDEKPVPVVEVEDAYKIAGDVPDKPGAADRTQRPCYPFERVIKGTSAIQQGIIMSEILGPPRALREYYWQSEG